LLSDKHPTHFPLLQNPREQAVPSVLLMLSGHNPDEPLQFVAKSHSETLLLQDVAEELNIAAQEPAELQNPIEHILVKLMLLKQVALAEHSAAVMQVPLTHELPELHCVEFSRCRQLSLHCEQSYGMFPWQKLPTLLHPVSFVQETIHCPVELQLPR